MLRVDGSLQTNLECDKILRNTKQKKVFGETLDNKLNFATHLLNIIKKVKKKFNALTRVQKYMNTDQMKFIFSSFIKSQFSYCLFISMFFTKRSLRRINNIHKWCLRFRQQNYIFEFERLLENANKKSVHQKCIEFLLIESLSSEKMPITSETFTHLNVKTSKKKEV